MKNIRNYDCVHRYIGECQECQKDGHNLDCPRYYPVLVSMGEAIMPNRETKDILIELLKNAKN